jgi:hypothetical protein
MESKEVKEETKQELRAIYKSLNPAQLKRDIERKLDLLYQAYKKKQKSQKVETKRKLKPNSLTFSMTQSKEFHLPS